MFCNFETSLLATMIVSSSPSGRLRSLSEGMVRNGSPSEAEDNIQTKEAEVEDNNQAKVE